MPQFCNPYEPPLDRSLVDGEITTKVSGASVFWFIGAYFLVDSFREIWEAVAHNLPLPPPLRFVASTSLLSAAEAVAALLICGIVGIIVKRSCPATRVSRTMAGVVFPSVLWVYFQFANIIGFKWPPGIISVPVAAIASTFVDRYLARVAR